jgi:hypothetical protein
MNTLNSSYDYVGFFATNKTSFGVNTLDSIQKAIKLAKRNGYFRYSGLGLLSAINLFMSDLTRVLTADFVAVHPDGEHASLVYQSEIIFI